MERIVLYEKAVDKGVSYDFRLSKMESKIARVCRLKNARTTGTARTVTHP
jgi:hypothetical protein